MKNILLDGKEVTSLVPESLPMLIHGEEGSGASLYTICLAAKWYRQSYNILFLCGYPMAEEEFSKQVGSDYKIATFYTKEKVEEFINALKQNLSDKTVVIVKNIELFGSNVYDAVQGTNNLVISGDITKSDLKENFLNKEYATQIFFSGIEGDEFPELEKYHGVVISGDYKGITHLQ